jgi:hypothetical protein
MFFQHELNDGDVETQALDSTNKEQNSFAFTSYTDLMMVCSVLLLFNFS